MDISLSEILAKMAVSNNKSEYIPRYKHDAIYFNNLDEELLDRERKILEKDLNYNNEIYETDIIKGNYASRSNNHFFRIDKDREKIWNIWLIIHSADIEEVNKNLSELNISIKIGGMTVFGELNMLHNLAILSEAVIVSVLSCVK